MLDRWDLTWDHSVDGPPRHGMVALVLPVRRPDGCPAALKLQPVDDESIGEPLGLRTWNGDGAVLLLAEDPETGSLLLERLDASRSLEEHPCEDEAVRLLAELLARLVAVPAPPELRHLRDVAGGMLAQAPGLLPRLRHPDERRLGEAGAAAVRDLIGERGDRLLHWDLHFDNVLAGAREPWLAIAPKPLAGDPGFELLPALGNRWADIAASGDVPRAVRRRFDALTEALGLDRRRAAGWTYGRVLQNALWDLEDGETVIEPQQVAISEAIARYW